MGHPADQQKGPVIFHISDRDEVRDVVLGLAHGDERVVAGAVVGSLALTDGDQWSDLDLTFAVVDGVDLLTVLDDWQASLAAAFGCVALFDLASGASLYRVLLFPGALQVDLSVTPAAVFGARGDTFRLLFGSANAQTEEVPRAAETMFGYAVHHAVRARVSIERGRLLQAEYWIGSLRGEVLSLACRHFGVTDWQARGAHLLPADVLEVLAAGLVGSLEVDELRRALAACIDALRVEGVLAPDLAGAVDEQLTALVV